jgi:hypothetical protein
MARAHDRRSVLQGLAGAAVVVAAGASRQVAAALPAGPATATVVQGRAELGQGERWSPLARGAVVPEGATVRTGKGSRVELTFADGSRFRVGSASELVVSQAAFEGTARKSVSLKLMTGRAWASVAKSAGAGNNFHVETTNAVAGVRGTSFAVLAAGDASALVRVYSGAVGVRPSAAGKPAERKQVAGPREIDRSQWEEIVATAMKQVRVSAVGELSPAEDFEDTGEDLEWAQWNQARDAARDAGR